MARLVDFTSKNADQMMNVNMHVVLKTGNPGLDSLLKVLFRNWNNFGYV